MSDFAVLLTTFNGEVHLPEQLQSLREQTASSIDIWLSDDGSTDGTAPLIRQAADGWSKGAFHVLEGPRAGFAENFRSLLCQPEISTEYVAFCDQDDIWDADKLEVARQRLKEIPASQPALYCGRTRLMNDDGRIVGQSPLMRRPPEFRNALVQSLAGGNTMVMNRAAFELVRSASMKTSFVSHDWWCYMLVSGAGGVVVYDPTPHIYYRQHGRNLVGSNSGLSARYRRFLFLLSGRFAAWTDTNLKGLQSNRSLLAPENQRLFDTFEHARADGRFNFLKTLMVHGYRRQSVAGNLSLLIGALLGKI
jgi:glycosyltransferase involved in cell wall biosynthesis